MKEKYAKLELEIEEIKEDVLTGSSTQPANDDLNEGLINNDCIGHGSDFFC